MIKLFSISFIDVHLLDIVDVLVVTFLFYWIYTLFKESRAAQMLWGMVVLFIMGFVAELMNLRALAWLIGSLQTVWVILFVIIFQPELRRMMMFMGQVPILRRFITAESTELTEELIYSIFELQKRQWGALVVVIRDQGLKTIIEKSVTIQAKVSHQLILSIFNPESPLHDGAIIVHQDRIISAKCILPLSENLDVDPTIGTRHLAGLGLSEESDALVIIVSEETGKISTAFQGVLTRGQDEPGLRTELYKYLSGRND